MPYTRMGSAWLMRKRFEEAQNMMKLQNKFCANMTNLTEYGHYFFSRPVADNIIGSLSPSSSTTWFIYCEAMLF